MANLTNLDTKNNDDFVAGDEVVFKSFDDAGLYFVVGYKLLGMLNGEICIQKCTSSTTDLDMGQVSDIGNHISPLCKVLNKSYMTDVIKHLVRAHAAQQEVS